MCAKFIGNRITFDDKYIIAVDVSVIVIFRLEEIPQTAAKFRNYLIFFFVLHIYFAHCYLYRIIDR